MALLVQIILPQFSRPLNGILAANAPHTIQTGVENLPVSSRQIFWQAGQQAYPAFHHLPIYIGEIWFLGPHMLQQSQGLTLDLLVWLPPQGKIPQDPFAPYIPKAGN